MKHCFWTLGLASFLVFGEVYISFGDYARGQISVDNTLGNETSIVTPNVSVDNSPADLIDGGVKRGINLFHSFKEFNITDGQRVIFSNPAGVENIFSRVTGTNSSTILGTLGVNGTANLLLLNPNGIIFGSNAKLDLRGSFLASTARSIKFSDSTEFSATNPSDSALLTINTPIGLQYGQNPGRILVRGQGSQLNAETNGKVLEVIKTGGLAVQPGQTLVLAGGEVMLQGGNAIAESGRIEIWGVGGNGLLKLSPSNPGWALSNESVQNFQDISLFQAAAIDTSGSTGGRINIQGRRLLLQDGSLIVSLTQGQGVGKDITINASESVQASSISPDGQPSVFLTEAMSTGSAGNILINTGKLFLQDGAQVSSSTFSQGSGGKITVNASQLFKTIGTTESGNFSSGVFAITLGAGEGGIVEVNTGKLVLEEGAQISAVSFGEGKGGSVSINALDSVEARGIARTASSPSGLFAGTLGSGDGGNVEINTRRLSVRDGAQISSTTFNKGQAGDVLVNAWESVEISGKTRRGTLNRTSGLYAGSRNIGQGGTVRVNTGKLTIEKGARISTEAFANGKGGNINIQAFEVKLTGTSDNGDPTIVFATTRGKGDGGEVRIDTSQLTVRDGAQIGAGTFSSGRGGNVFINASDKIELVGTVPQVPNRPFFRDQSGEQFPSGFFTGSEDTGTAGNLKIETQKLMLRDGAGIGVNNQGIGNAGNLEVSAGNIFLSNQAFLSATTTSGEGGNIALNVEDLLLLRRNSQISTTAGIDSAGGDGGNILINSSLLAAIPSENSDITANAFTGKGGNINIRTQGIFGLEFRNFQTPLSDITASSEFGIAGVVDIDILDVDPAKGLTELPTAIVDASKLIAQNFCRVVSQESQFVVTGRGGLPNSPNQTLRANTPWEDLRLVEENKPRSLKLPPKSRSEQPKKKDKPSERIIEAQGWVTTPDGDVLLTAKPAVVNSEGLWLHPQDCQFWKQTVR